MQIPTRRSQQLKKNNEEDHVHLTPEGVEKLNREKKRLLAERPAIIEDLVRAQAMGDFSENAEYQEAKFKLRRLNGRLDIIADRLLYAVIIERPTQTETVQLRSIVTVETNGKRKTYEIVGPKEINPPAGRISYLSPLGAALINHRVNDLVEVTTETSVIRYKIIKIA